METMEMQLPMSHRQKQILDACIKIQQGQKLFIEGRTALEHLAGEKQSEVRALPKKPKLKAKKTIANKISRKKIQLGPERLDEIASKILKLAKDDEWLTTHAIMKKAKTSFYTAKKVLEGLQKKKLVKLVTKPNERMPHLPRDYWAIA